MQTGNRKAISGLGEEPNVPAIGRVTGVGMYCVVCHIDVKTLNLKLTRKLSYRKDDRAMRPIYGCLSCLFTESD